MCLVHRRDVIIGERDFCLSLLIGAFFGTPSTIPSRKNHRLYKWWRHWRTNNLKLIPLCWIIEWWLIDLLLLNILSSFKILIFTSRLIGLGTDQSRISIINSIVGVIRKSKNPLHKLSMCETRIFILWRNVTAHRNLVTMIKSNYGRQSSQAFIMRPNNLNFINFF